MTSPSYASMNVQDFLAYVKPRPKGERWELIEGQPVKMELPTYAHRRVGLNLIGLLNVWFDVRRIDCFGYQEVGLCLSEYDRIFARPDIAVCDGIADYVYHSNEFRLVGEIISSTNTQRMIDLKMRMYREARQCQYVLLINARRIELELRARHDGWLPHLLNNADDAIDLPDFGFRCTLADIYRRTPIDPGRRRLLKD